LLQWVLAVFCLAADGTSAKLIGTEFLYGSQDRFPLNMPCMSRTATHQFEPDCQAGSPIRHRGALGALGKAMVGAFHSPAVWIPALVLAFGTLVFRYTDADIALVRPYFAEGSAGKGYLDRWPLTAAFPWKALYDWGIYPAWVLGLGGLIVWMASFRWQKLVRWRDPGLFFGLLLLLGPGLLVNGVFKPVWARPRPNNVVAFGGQSEFHPVWSWGRGQGEASFPSGHASTGFYLMAPAFVYRRRRPGLALGFLALGIVFGCAMGLARIVAGGHFPSDVLWAGGFVYFLGLALAAPFRFDQH
jgi:lipid A 4'-phosphatase